MTSGTGGKRGSSDGSHFHAAGLKRGEGDLPAVPVHRLTLGAALGEVGEGVKVGAVAVVVPPAALEHLGAVLVVVTVLVELGAAEGLTVVLDERVA